MVAAGEGPDLVIVGAARSGTSYLAAELGNHPRIDPGSIKEPNFYSRHFERGPAWYDGLYRPRTPGGLRMDASVSYTFPHHPEALDRLAAAATARLVVYGVRDPIPRAVSHFLYHKHYFKNEPATSFGAALRSNPLYAGASDYEHWLSQLSDRFGDRLLVVPFAAITEGGVESVVYDRLGLDADAEAIQEAEVHRNNVVTFKNDGFRRASRMLRRSRYYPVVREKLGADRIRRLRSLLTREATLPTRQETLASCTPEQLAELQERSDRATAAVHTYLEAQDARSGLAWAQRWAPTPDARGGGTAGG